MKDRLEEIRNAFGECKRIDKSICHIKTSYEKSSLGFFFILDDKDDEPVRIVNGEGNYQLRIKNSDKKEICLIKTDKCLFGNEHKKCDCILLSKEECFLVEISESSQRNKKRNDAVEQLSSTIIVFRENGINLCDYNSSAIICFKGGKTKPIQASFNTKQAIFLEKYKIKLEEGNLISF